MTRIESLDFNHRTREDESFIPKSYPHPEVYCSPSVDMNHIIVPLARARTAIVLFDFLTVSCRPFLHLLDLGTQYNVLLIRDVKNGN